MNPRITNTANSKPTNNKGRVWFLFWCFLENSGFWKSVATYVFGFSIHRWKKFHHFLCWRMCSDKVPLVEVWPEENQFYLLKLKDLDCFTNRNFLFNTKSVKYLFFCKMNLQNLFFMWIKNGAVTDFNKFIEFSALNNKLWKLGKITVLCSSVWEVT